MLAKTAADEIWDGLLPYDYVVKKWMEEKLTEATETVVGIAKDANTKVENYFICFEFLN